VFLDEVAVVLFSVEGPVGCGDLGHYVSEGGGFPGSGLSDEECVLVEVVFFQGVQFALFLGSAEENGVIQVRILGNS